jgi:flagellar hook-associated protein 3 FlgL
VLNRLCGKLEKAINKMDVEYDELDTKAAFLDGNSTRLTADVKALNEQILGIEEIDPVAAITSLSWAQYCYNAGLKIGTSILSQSLIDYMN